MNSSSEKAPDDDLLTPAKILEVARAQVRRFGEAKTNVVDIARALGTSHTSIYRHFRSKAEVFDAIVQSTMRDEEELAKAFADASQPAAERLTGLVMALHRRKLENLSSDPEVYRLYRRVVEERPDIVRAYSASMTALVAAILADGVQRGEFKLDDVNSAAEIVRDAVTVYVHPAHVAANASAGISMEPAVNRMMVALIVAFRAGLSPKSR
jgi:AcrR family transcriptional regulator